MQKSYTINFVILLMSVLKIHCVGDFGSWMTLSQTVLFLNALYFFENDTCMFYKAVSLEGSVSHR